MAVAPPTSTVKAHSSQADDATSPSTHAALNPPTRTREFLGAPGAAAVFVLCHLVLLSFYIACAPSTTCGQGEGVTWLLTTSVKLLAGTYTLYNPTSLTLYALWLLWLVALFHIVPGRWVNGTRLRNGTTLSYKINALPSLIITLATCVAVLATVGRAPFLYLHDHMLYLVAAAFLLSAIASAALYLASFRPGVLLALGGNTGNPVYDYFIGRELNPRVGQFDIKCFTELRPGLIGWLVVNFCSAVAQYDRTGGTITDSMVLVQLFQAWYVFDSLANEPAVLTTMDIVTDGLGWMLTFGNLVWVPFSFSLQARYLALHPLQLGVMRCLGILALQAIGYWIFRSANLEKDRFRKNPSDPAVQHLAYISTKTGSRLLVSGWWGRARHINYLGDWIMSVAWCLPCGFGSVIPYLYPIYFIVLLIHRERRDEHKCHLKYGADWRRYRRIVPWRIVPYIY
ncbi:ERG4/ERG24 ergosterol biosynthesis protein [Syncephalis pseudoplumigaleata]|uniref:Delta(14)-sterol reductase ERG24 n=1 Tax=Syncephalis pseudoplumigaleata TaxID=1712513 RepID=A0A4P9YVL3_9FUNG|nr:ERG4/ERG24 ergosterol biosynthesis protein [Syncephalis pseudoplumigaleata]|eukprot:RKP23271.1 ERG4/ERG24 ergosterol biosynthesis protein [Syncephalis pseudoplumigaleata]